MPTVAYSCSGVGWGRAPFRVIKPLTASADDTGVAGGVVGLASFTDSFGYTHKSATEIANIKSWIVSILMLGAYVNSPLPDPSRKEVNQRFSRQLCRCYYCGPYLSTMGTEEGPHGWHRLVHYRKCDPDGGDPLVSPCPGVADRPQLTCCLLCGPGWARCTLVDLLEALASAR